MRTSIVLSVLVSLTSGCTIPLESAVPIPVTQSRGADPRVPASDDWAGYQAECSERVARDTAALRDRQAAGWLATAVGATLLSVGAGVTTAYAADKDKDSNRLGTGVGVSVAGALAIVGGIINLSVPGDAANKVGCKSEVLPASSAQAAPRQ